MSECLVLHPLALQGPEGHGLPARFRATESTSRSFSSEMYDTKYRVGNVSHVWPANNRATSTCRSRIANLCAPLALRNFVELANRATVSESPFHAAYCQHVKNDRWQSFCPMALEPSRAVAAVEGAGKLTGPILAKYLSNPATVVNITYRPACARSARHSAERRCVKLNTHGELIFDQPLSAAMKSSINSI